MYRNKDDTVVLSGLQPVQHSWAITIVAVAIMASASNPSTRSSSM
jgi:hypothetical protein